jgi:hypothetical protein
MSRAKEVEMFLGVLLLLAIGFVYWADVRAGTVCLNGHCRFLISIGIN